VANVLQQRQQSDVAKVRKQRQQWWQQLGVKQVAVCFCCVCRAIMVVRPSLVSSLWAESLSTEASLHSCRPWSIRYAYACARIAEHPETAYVGNVC